MKPEHWNNLLAVINGEVFEPLPVGFIIDSPWLPGWAGISALDYYSSEQMWFEANLRAGRQFPDIIFLPGFCPSRSIGSNITRAKSNSRAAASNSQFHAGR